MNIKLEESTIVVERGIVSHLSDYFYSANKIMIISDTEKKRLLSIPLRQIWLRIAI